MQKMPKYWAACSLAFALAGCGGDSAKTACIDDDPQCGVACNAGHPCSAGMYCGGDSLCGKECTGERGCSPGQTCSSDGHCQGRASMLPAQTPTRPTGAAGTRSSSGIDNGSSVDNPGLISDAGTRPEASMPEGICQTANVTATRVIPTVVFVIDQSGSMNDQFGSMGNRWNVLRDFLLAPSGLIDSLQGQVRFGIAMYTTPMNAQNNDPTCPLVTSVMPAIDNLSAISQAYQGASPLGDTPTGDSIDKIVAGLPKPGLDMDPDPTVLVLATDGEPDRCEELNPQNGQAETVTAVQNAFQQSIRTFVISVGNEISRMHLQDVANAGIGHDAANPAPYWIAGDDASLRDALTEIIANQVSCEVTLNGMVKGDNACDGKVTLNGQDLMCKGADGWELSDPTHIRLLGKSCMDFKTQKAAMVRATFPCTVEVAF